MKRTNRRPEEVLTLRIDDVAPGGMGVAHVTMGAEARAVFVPRCAVGDEVLAAVDASARPARARVLRLLTRGAGRVDPPCLHVDACGACDWMHLSEGAQAAAREDHLRRALPAPWKSTPIAVLEAPKALGYRTRARLHVRASGGRAVAGFHAARSHAIVEVDRCLALDGRLAPVAALVVKLFDGAHGEGEVQAALGAEGKLVLDVAWDGKVPPALYARIESEVTSGGLGGASLRVGEVTRPAVIGDPTPVMTAADGAPLRLSSGGFGQASAESNVVLGRRVIQLAEVGLPSSREAVRVLELYAGAGNFTVLLARSFGTVVAVESSGPACERARENLAARGLRARVTCADADGFGVPPSTDLVVLDPPRTGARKASAALAASTVKVILYVSCDPPTLGRDLALLVGRFEPYAIESLAMFPGTSHAETVVALRRVRRETG